jgi:hypothetical protein
MPSVMKKPKAVAAVPPPVAIGKAAPKAKSKGRPKKVVAPPPALHVMEDGGGDVVSSGSEDEVDPEIRLRRLSRGESTSVLLTWPDPTPESRTAFGAVRPSDYTRKKFARVIQLLAGVILAGLYVVFELHQNGEKHMHAVVKATQACTVAWWDSLTESLKSSYNIYAHLRYAVEKMRVPLPVLPLVFEMCFPKNVQNRKPEAGL